MGFAKTAVGFCKHLGEGQCETGWYTLSYCLLLKETAAIFTIQASKQKLTAPGTILQQAFKGRLPMGSTVKCQVSLLHSGEGRPSAALNVHVRIKQTSLEPFLLPFLVVIHEYCQVPETCVYQQKKCCFAI